MRKRFVVVIRTLENRLNHPHWKQWEDSPVSRWGPVSQKVCDLADWLTGGECHD